MEKLDVAIGDEVVIVPRLGSKYLTKVTRITPSGIIVTGTSSKWNPDGRERGGDVKWGCSYIRKATKQDRRELRHKMLVETLKLVRWSDYPTDVLEAINAIRKEHDAKATDDQEHA